MIIVVSDLWPDLPRRNKFKAALCNFLGRPDQIHIESDLSFFCESKSKKWYICCMCAISILTVLKFSFCIFYFRFCKPASNILFLVIENVFQSALDGTMILYTQTEIRRTIHIFATRNGGAISAYSTFNHQNMSASPNLLQLDIL